MIRLVNLGIVCIIAGQFAIQGVQTKTTFPEPHEKENVVSQVVQYPTVTPTSIPTPEPTPAPKLSYVGYGYAAHYGYDTMDAVARNRGYKPQPCQISWTEATDADIGRWFYVESTLQFNDGIHGAWCQIMDMPQDQHYQSIKDRGIIVELGWGITPYLCGLSYPGQEPPKACPVNVYQ
jgi:hypothetical protein